MIRNLCVILDSDDDKYYAVQRLKRGEYKKLSKGYDEQEDAHRVVESLESRKAPEEKRK